MYIIKIVGSRKKYNKRREKKLNVFFLILQIESWNEVNDQGMRTGRSCNIV